MGVLIPPLNKSNDNNDRIVFVDFSDATLEIEKNNVEENKIIIKNINYLVEQEEEPYVNEFSTKIGITKFGPRPSISYNFFKKLIEDEGYSDFQNFLNELYKQRNKGVLGVGYIILVEVFSEIKYIVNNTTPITQEGNNFKYYSNVFFKIDADDYFNYENLNNQIDNYEFDYEVKDGAPKIKTFAKLDKEIYDSLRDRFNF